MARRRSIDITVHSPARPDAVYALLADSSTWPQWSPIDSVSLERDGTPPPEGVGAIRVNRRGRITGRDEITELVPGRRLGYRSLSGLPVVGYRAQVDVEPDGTGSTIRWRSSFVPKYPGTGLLWQWGIRRLLRQCAEGLARYAAVERSDPARPST